MKNPSSASKRFFSGTLLSRITGMLRDISMAAIFGSNPFIAIFMVAFRLSNLLRRILGDGALQSAFIPYYQKLALDKNDSDKIFFINLKKTLAKVLFIIILLTEITLISVVHLDLFDNNSKEIIKLTAIMFPSIIFICFYGINTAFLQCHDHYFLNSLAPVIFNITWITAVILLKNIPANIAVIYLSYIIIIAFALQWLITAIQTHGEIKHIPPLKTNSIQFLQDNKPFLKALLLGIVGVAAIQVNSACDAIFATIADTRGPAYLWYSIRIQQLPIALVGLSITASLMPLLSHSIKSGKTEDFQALFKAGLQKNISVILSITFALLLLGPSLNGIIYGHGAFEQKTWSITTKCLWAYNIGLLPVTLTALFSTLFYANGNYRTPAITSIISVIINIILNYIFVYKFELGAISIAFATSISGWANVIILGYNLHQYNLKQILSNSIKDALITIIICCIALFCTSIIIFYIFSSVTWLMLLKNDYIAAEHYRTIYHVIEFISSGILFSAILLASAKLFRYTPLQSINKIINFQL